MWVTGCLMELWKTLFAGRGKAVLAFPCAANGVSHSAIACYPHFHDARDTDRSKPLPPPTAAHSTRRKRLQSAEWKQTAVPLAARFL